VTAPRRPDHRHSGRSTQRDSKHRLTSFAKSQPRSSSALLTVAGTTKAPDRPSPRPHPSAYGGIAWAASGLRRVAAVEQGGRDSLKQNGWLWQVEAFGRAGMEWPNQPATLALDATNSAAPAGMQQ